MSAWYDPGEPKPRELQPMPRCANCGEGIHHPLHAAGDCFVVLPGVGRCPCAKPELFTPGASA